jgi:hypothetical protein
LGFCKSKLFWIFIGRSTLIAYDGLGTYEATQVKTPNLDQFAKQGIKV